THEPISPNQISTGAPHYPSSPQPCNFGRACGMVVFFCEMYGAHLCCFLSLSVFFFFSDIFSKIQTRGHRPNSSSCMALGMGHVTFCSLQGMRVHQGHYFNSCRVIWAQCIRVSPVYPYCHSAPLMIHSCFVWTGTSPKESDLCMSQ